MRLFAISDLHMEHPANRQPLRDLPARPDDWLVIAGDVGRGLEHLALCFDILVPRFARVVWTPGNHDLWSRPDRPDESRGVARYEELVALARAYGVITPEDPFPIFDHPGGPILIAPVFVLYDYSFRPGSVPLAGVVGWAAEANSACADEYLLHPDPFPSRNAWCKARCAQTEARLAARPQALPTVLISHFSLEEALAVLPRAPRFTPWCGTWLTRDWHRRFDARAVVFGHLHMPGTRWIDGVPFQEVSLGYPRQRRNGSAIGDHLREVRLEPNERTPAIVGEPGET
ncbi:metallophosphoesterase family protein [Yoonia sp. R2-816]|uniref:metallophosphoesterase family protein n=1 Tax=Yoonia sp. R2-816 TaxID=3342638 RepID=UPI00372AB3FE